MGYFSEQDKFLADLLKAYKTGKFTEKFEPYFDWKQGGVIFTRREAEQMKAAAEDQLAELDAATDADGELRTFISSINDEISSLLPMLL